MRWKGRRGSSNVEDRRAMRSGGGRAGGAGILFMIMRAFGIKGVIVAVVVGFALWKLGVVDPSMLVGGGAPASSSAYRASPQEEELYEFTRVVLAGTEEVWAEQFAEAGLSYRPPTLVVYRNRVSTGCGAGSAAMGPFYCSADERIYVDLSFYDELARSFKAPGDFAQAYVIAHEVGHHVQNLLGSLQKVHQKRGDPLYNRYSVRLELQADYLAGVWAHHSQKYLEKGDIEEAMRAANAIGDDAIQMKSRGKVVPHAFTHGTSEQRMRWFMKGMKSGKIEGGDTFAPRYESL